MRAFLSELLNFVAFIGFMGVNVSSFLHNYLRAERKTAFNLLSPVASMADSAYDRIEKVSGLEALWQSHLALANDKAHNTSEDMIANLDASR